MINIFKYKDYRQFLKDYYSEKKKLLKAFSFRFFAKKANLTSPNYLKLVMDGKRNLTHRNVKKFADGLGLQEKEAHFFENLVFMNQAKNDEEKEFYKKNLRLLKDKGYGTTLTKEQYQVCSKWFYLVIKEMLLLSDFKEQSRWIADKLDRSLTKREILDAIELLIKLNLVERDPKTQKLVSKSIDFIGEPNVASEAVKKFYKEMIKKAHDCVDHQSADERFLNSLTIAINTKDLPRIFEKIRKFRNELDEFILRSKKYDSVYQLNIQFFRLINKF